MCEPDAEQAIKEMNGFQFNGTRLVVRRQEPRKKYVFARSFKKKKIHLKFQYLAVLFYLKMFPWKSYLFCCRGPIKREFDSDRGKSSPNANGTSSLVY